MKKGFEVAVCVKIPLDEYGERDIDAAVFETRDFAKKEDAMRYAKSRLADDCFGSVRVTPFELQPYEAGSLGLFREYVGDSDHVEA